MAKRKFLTSLLGVTLVGSLVACDPAGGTSGSTNSGNNNGNTNASEVLDTINSAAVATRNKLAQELEKDVLSLKLDFDYSMKATSYIVEDSYIWENENWSATGSETSDPSSAEMGEVGSAVGNFDTKYYTDFLATQGETSLTNSTTAFISMDAKQKEYDKDGKVESEASSLVEAKITGTEMTARMKSGEYSDETSRPVDAEFDATLASVVDSLKTASKLTDEEATSMLKMMLMSYVGVNPENEQEVEMFDSMYNSVFGWLDGSVTSSQVVDLLMPMFPTSEMSEDEVAAVKKVFVAVLDYVKAVEISNVVKFTTKTENGKTLVTATFDYAEFKKLADKVFDELTTLFVNNIPSEEVETEDIKSDMAHFEETFFALLPEKVELSVTFGITGALFSSFEFDAVVGGANLPTPSSSLVEGESVEEGTNRITRTTYVTDLELSSGFSFEFGASSYQIPEFSISVPANQ